MIDHQPDIDSLLFATGGCGHAFKVRSLYSPSSSPLISFSSTTLSLTSKLILFVPLFPFPLAVLPNHRILRSPATSRYPFARTQQDVVVPGPSERHGCGSSTRRRRDKEGVGGGGFGDGRGSQGFEVVRRTRLDSRFGSFKGLLG